MPNGLGLEAMRGINVDFAAPSFHERTIHELHRLAILFQVYKEAHHAALPPNLADLAQLAPGVPMPKDYYAGEPFHYDRSRRIFWSVGENGVDDGGKAGPNRYAGPDLVWPIP